MTSREILDHLAQRTQLLRADMDEDEREPNAVAFTRLAAWELKGEGWAAIKNLQPNNKHGIEPGLLMNSNTREQVRIIANVGTKQQSVAWEDLAKATKDVQHEAPIDPSTNPALQNAIDNRPAPAAAAKSRVDPDDHRAAVVALMTWYAAAADDMPKPDKLSEEAVTLGLAMAHARIAKK